MDRVAGTLTAVVPSQDTTLGGATVTLTGSNLGSGSDITAVSLRGQPVASIVRQSATHVVVVAAPSAVKGPGTVEVLSTTFGRTNLSNAFTYLPRTSTLVARFHGFVRLTVSVAAR